MRVLIRAVLTAACAAMLSGCSQESPKQGAESPAASPYASYRFGEEGVVDMGVQPASLPEASLTELLSRDLTLAAALKKDGLTLRCFGFSKGIDVNEYLASGKLEVGVLGDMPSLVAAASGKVLIVARLKQGFSSIVAARPMLVRDLQGKRVAAAPGSTAHFTLLNALQDEGLTEEDVTIVQMDVKDMPQALAAGRIDAFSAWEPTPTVAFAAYPQFRLVHKGVSFAFLAMRRDFVLTHPRVARDILAAVARGCLYLRQPGVIDTAAQWIKDSAVRFSGGGYPLTTEQIRFLARNDLLLIPEMPQIPELLLRHDQLLMKEFEFLKQKGAIPSAVTWPTVQRSFATDLLREVQKERVGYAIEAFDYRVKEEVPGR